MRFIFSGTLITVGAIILVSSGLLYSNTGSFVRHASATKGIVVSVGVTTAPGELNLYTPTVEFTTEKGQTIRFTQTYSRVGVGDRVNVLYEPSNPSEARISEFWALWGWLLIALAIGSFFAIWGVQVLATQIRSNKKPRES